MRNDKKKIGLIFNVGDTSPLLKIEEDNYNW
jgi:hypothetical protein